MKIKNKNSGFTLIELIIAIAIFIVIATASYNALNTFNNSTKIYNKNADILLKLQKFSLIFTRDFSQILNQEINMNKQQIGLRSLQNDESIYIIYDFGNKKITRQSNGYKTTLLDNIDEIKLRLLDSDKKWHTKWQNNNKNKTYLLALELKFTHQKYGEITQLAIIDE